MSNIRTVKVVIFGDANTGKSSFLRHMTKQPFSEEYISTKVNEPYYVPDPERKVVYEIWDTSGQNDSSNNDIYNGAEFGIFAYSIDNKTSLNSKSKWISTFRLANESFTKTPIMFIACKADLYIKTDTRFLNNVVLSNKRGFDVQIVLNLFDKVLNNTAFESIKMTRTNITSDIPKTNVEDVTLENLETENDISRDTEEKQVKLVSHSQGTHKSISDYIAHCARVSNPSTQEKNQNNARLINYLIKHNHWSPFEMANICLEIITTRDISRQILRHRSFSYQEFSLRYATVLDTCVDREARLQDTKNRQNSLITDDINIIDPWKKAQEQVLETCSRNYQEMLNMGIAKEQARSLLPEGLTKTKMYMNGTIRSWIHYIQIRSGPETQKEHRIIARQCAQVISTVFPEIMNFVIEE